jgi:hydroxymethylpyrimidine/phosphomethylpyrimidine kinase
METMADPTLLTIAGHDPSSGAGITADLQIFAAHGFFGTSVITALTVQSTLGVAAIHPVSPEFLSQTLDHLYADLLPTGIKIGMLGSGEVAMVVANFLKEKGSATVIYDPVLRSSSGASLLPDEAIHTLHEHLLPAIDWITPNWSELAALTELSISSLDQAEAATHALGLRHTHLHIVTTGGDHAQPTEVLRLPTGETHRIPGEHIETTSTHGTGCAFSSALLCHLVQGNSPLAAVQNAKAYVAQAMRTAKGRGHGRGPLNLLWPLTQTAH